MIVGMNRVVAEQFLRHFSMEALPNEVWDDIMNRLDFFDLVTLRKVSKLSQEIANSFIRRKYEYYEKCLKEIPKKYWISILEDQNHPQIRLDNFDEMKMHSEIWISMYRSWIGWNTLLDKTPKQTCIEVSIPYHISCLDVTGNIIAIGSMFGQGCFYDMIQLSQNPFYEIPCPVHGVWFWRKGDDIRAITYSETQNDKTLLKRWDVISKNQLEEIEHMRPTLISTSLDYLYTLIPYLDGNEEDEDELRMSYTLKIERLGSGLEVRTIQLPKVGFIDFMNADGDRVLMSSISQREDEIKIYASSLKYDFMEIFSKPWNMQENGVVNIEKSGVLSAVGLDDLKIGFSVDGRDWKFYDIQRDLKINSKVAAILYHVGLLILAFESGEVRITHVEDRLEFLNFETMRSITLKFPSDAVVAHLNVTEYNSKQYLIVTAGLKLYFVEFNENYEISQS